MIEFKRLHMDKVYDAKIVALYKDYLVTPDGTEVCYDLVAHKSGGGAGILLVDDDENIYLVRQYRNTINRVNLEIPAGAYSFPGESGEVCAIREAEEEVGYKPGRIFHVSNIISSIGAYDEMTDIYIGLDLEKGTVKPDPYEYIELVNMPIAEAMKMIYSGEIIDSKTVIALFAYQDMKQKGIFD